MSGMATICRSVCLAFGMVLLLLCPSAVSAQSLEVLHSFSGCPPNGCIGDDRDNDDGSHPRSTLVQSSDGYSSGTTYAFQTDLQLGSLALSPTASDEVKPDQQPGAVAPVAKRQVLEASGRLPLAFVPNADIRLAYRGAEGLSLDRDGSLHVETPLGTFTDARPLSYQELGGQRVAVASRYRLGEGERYGFATGAYGCGRPLVIDPRGSFARPTWAEARSTRATGSQSTRPATLTSQD